MFYYEAKNSALVMTTEHLYVLDTYRKLRDRKLGSNEQNSPDVT